MSPLFLQISSQISIGPAISNHYTPPETLVITFHKHKYLQADALFIYFGFFNNNNQITKCRELVLLNLDIVQIIILHWYNDIERVYTTDNLSMTKVF
jgi:hypothetical protein